MQNAIGEMLEAADQSRKALEEFEPLRAPIDAIQRAAIEIGRAWSGSNLGYQSRVYYADFQPVPGNVVFSVEWGLEERWGAHIPDPGWRMWEEQDVRAAIVDLAGGVRADDVIDQIQPFDEIVEAHRENLISILMGANPKGSDSFLARKLADLEKHEVPSAQDFTNSWVRRGSVMSRDGDAMGGGFRAAAHQKVLGVAAHGTAVGDALRWLESLARQSAAHLRRIDPKGTSGVQTGGSTIFIGHGHAAAWRELKDFLRDRLEVPVSEYNTVSAAGVATAERLKELLDNAKFAFLIMTGEDEQADGAVRARQNVIQEIGLFQGRLGFGKAIILLEEGCAEFSNMAGLGVIPFPRGQLAAGFEEIRRVLEREGII